jgi:hypothetical protein
VAARARRMLGAVAATLRRWHMRAEIASAPRAYGRPSLTA